MFRNQYDTGLFSKVEYAMEAVKQGSVAIGLRSETHVVLASVNKAQSKLSSQIFKADNHIGVAITGLIADGPNLSKYIRSECYNFSYTFGLPLPVSYLVGKLADKAQGGIKLPWKRPYRVGLLVAGLDGTGPNLYYNCPSGNGIEYVAFAIGSRSEAAKTYMAPRVENIVKSTREDLLKGALFALRETLQGEKLQSSICTVAVVGVGEPFHILDSETVQALIDKPAVGQSAPAEEGAASWYI